MIRPMIFTLLTLGLFTLSTSHANAEPLFTATYKGKHSGIGITLVRTLTKTADNHYVMRSDASSFVGSIDETSEFLIENKTIMPIRYDYVRSVLGKKSKQHLLFDWETMQVAYRRLDKSKKNKDYALTKGALDNALFQLKMQQEVFQGKDQFKFEFAKEREIKQREFEKSKQTPFTIDGITYNAIELKRINQPDKKQTYILLIPELNYQIAKITHVEEDGSTYNVEMKSFTANDDALTHFYESIM